MRHKPLPLDCRSLVSGSISLPFRGSFRLSLAVLCAIGQLGVLSLREWSPQIPTTFRGGGSTREHIGKTLRFCIQGFHLLWRNVPDASANVKFCNFPEIRQNLNDVSHDPYKAKAAAMALCRFRLFPVRSPLLRESHSISFPGTTRRFYFVPCVPLSGAMVLPIAGCPIRRSGPQRLFAPPPGLSQLTTSFIHSNCQGIHQGPLLTCIPTTFFLSNLFNLLNDELLHVYTWRWWDLNPRHPACKAGALPLSYIPFWLKCRIPDNGPHWI